MQRKIPSSTILFSGLVVLILSLVATISSVSADAYSNFSCGSGSSVSTLSLQSETAGWGTASRLLDNDQYQGWATGNPAVATATIDLGGNKTVKEVQVFVPTNQTTSQSVAVELLNSSGNVIGSGSISLSTSGWRKATFNTTNVNDVKLTRDPGENIFEMRVCAGSGGGGGTPSVSVNDVTVSEGAGNANFTVSLSATTSSAVTVQFATSNGTASAGSDYNSVNTTVTIPANQLSTTVAVGIINDSSSESAESFNVTLSNPSNATLGDSSGVGTITDNDGGGSGNCSSSNYSATSVPQNCLPTAMGTNESPTFGNWRNKIDGSLGNANNGEDCRDLHDRYWVKGDDGLAYHTWHPASVNGCEFRHEHGTDPATSDILSYAGGYPPFAFVMETQHNANPGMMRHEDHFGHKVVVANNIRLAIGNSADGTNNTVYDAGITCDWFSKIHQGSYSSDALTNHLHEYYLSVKCNDTQQGQPTEFSVKILGEWGDPNEVISIGGSGVIFPVTNHVNSQLTFPWNDAPDPITAPHLTSPTGNGGNREFKQFSGLQWKKWDSTANADLIRQPELWTMNGNFFVDIPGGGEIKLAPYYGIKNPARLLGTPDTQLVRTIELCYDGSNARKPGGYCQILPSTYPGASYWKTASSPFNGTLRSVNFKGIGLTNENGPTEFCTDVFGHNPTNTPCSSTQVKQKASAIRNYWQEQNYTGSQNCILDTSGVCHSKNLEGTLERWTLVYNYSTNQWVATNVGANFVGGSSYIGAGIGYEWIINNGNDAGVRPPN